MSFEFFFDNLVLFINNKDNVRAIGCADIIDGDDGLRQKTPDWIKIKLLRFLRSLYKIELASKLAKKFVAPVDIAMRREFFEEFDMIDYYLSINISKKIALVDEFSKVNTRLNYSDIIEKLKNSLQLSIPFSYLRLGDGEGNVLGLLSGSFPYAEKLWAKKICDLQFSESVITNVQMRAIANHLSVALSDVDILGIMRPENLIGIYSDRKLPYDRQLSGNFENYSFFVNNLQITNSPVNYTDSSVNYDPIFEEMLFGLASGAKGVGIIGPHDQAVSYFIDRGVSNIKFFKIPGEKKYFPSDSCHYPDVFSSVISNLKEDDFSGWLFYIGAGLLGKYYCHFVKKQGGVAVDIGSSMDRISGYLKTRGG